MCNAWNHPPECRCGWGGDGHAGKRGIGLQTHPALYEDFCRPTRCPRCGQNVYFIRHNHGSVWVDPPLGKPWPKHPCFEPESVDKASLDWYEKTAASMQDPILGLFLGSALGPGTEGKWWYGGTVAVKAENGLYHWLDLRSPRELKTKYVDLNGIAVLFSLTDNLLHHPRLPAPETFYRHRILTVAQERSMKMRMIQGQYSLNLKQRNRLINKYIKCYPDKEALEKINIAEKELDDQDDRLYREGEELCKVPTLKGEEFFYEWVSRGNCFRKSKS